MNDEEAPKSRVLISSLETAKYAMEDLICRVQQMDAEEHGSPREDCLPKVAVFLDNPNLYIASQRSDEKHDPAKVIEIALQHGNLTHAFAYIRLSPHDTGTEGWIAKYRKLGFEPRFIIDYNHDHESKDVDTYLVADALETAYTTHTNIFVIASGDGDYVPMVRLLRKMGKKTVVCAYEKTLSRFLAGVANEVITLD